MARQPRFGVRSFFAGRLCATQTPRPIRCKANFAETGRASARVSAGNADVPVGCLRICLFVGMAQTTAKSRRGRRRSQQTIDKWSHPAFPQDSWLNWELWGEFDLLQEMQSLGSPIKLPNPTGPFTNPQPWQQTTLVVSKSARIWRETGCLMWLKNVLTVR